MAQIFKRESALRDLVTYFVHLADESGLGTAEKFLVCVEQSFDDLARTPSMGSPVESRRAELAGFRKWRVRDFENFLIFYVPVPGGLEVVRVIHGARDWAAILDL